jgi:hypothetical protein
MIHQDSFLLVLSLIVLGIFLVGWLLQRSKRRRARSWPMVEGKVDSAKVRVEQRGENQSALIGEVGYSYSLNGKTSAGFLHRTFFIASHADRWISAYPVGRAVTIRYNPKNEKKSVMDERDQALEP